VSNHSLDKVQQKKQDIIRAANDLFVKQGYHGTSMRQIARAANIALGGLYNHFDSKQQVFKQVFLEYHPYHEVIPAMLEAQGDTAEQVVRDAFERMLTALEQRPGFMNLMFIEIVEFNSQHINELMSELVPVELQIVERVKDLDPGRLKPIPPMMFIRTFLGMFISYKITDIVLARQAPSEFQDKALEYFIDIYLHGILADN
jgi:AcrR family transcriptional regulator